MTDDTDDTDDNRYGTLVRGDGTYVLRFERRLAHPVERVWRGLTEPEGQRHWFPQEIEGELRTGEKLHFLNPEPYRDMPGFDGEVLACDPPRVLEFRWGTDTLRWELLPDGDGCLMIFTDTITELGKAARDGASWHLCLDMLTAWADGTEPPARDRWQQLHPEYVTRFGPDAATIGRPGAS